MPAGRWHAFASAHLARCLRQMRRSRARFARRSGGIGRRAHRHAAGDVLPEGAVHPVHQPARRGYGLPKVGVCRQQLGDRAARHPLLAAGE